MGYRVLIVDDFEDTAVSMAYLLQTYGHTAVYTTKSSEALEKARQFRPHIAFIDIAMPGIDGWELCRLLKADKTLDGLLCYAVSGFGKPDYERKCLDAGFAGYFRKPISLDDLRPVIGTG